MPAGVRTKQYVVSCTGTNVNKSIRPGPAVPNRVSLTVQNTGAAAGLFRIGGPVRNDGGDISLAAGALVQWDQADTCPTEDLNFSSAGTTFAVVEGVKS